MTSPLKKNPWRAEPIHIVLGKKDFIGIQILEICLQYTL